MNDATNAAALASLTANLRAKHDKLRKPRACSSFIQRFLEVSDNDRVAIVTNLNVVSDDDPVEPLRALVRPTVDPKLVDLICEAAIGMAKERADQLIRNGKPALIDADAFKANFVTFVQKNNLPGLLTSFAPAPGSGEVAMTLSTRPIFIRQLEIIDTPESDRLRSVSDFLRTSADKSIWAEKGLIFEGSLQEWDDDLLRHHGLICGEIGALRSERRGIQGAPGLPALCAAPTPLDGRAVPGHFVHGCFNPLADELRLGWHSDYQTMLRGIHE